MASAASSANPRTVRQLTPCGGCHRHRPRRRPPPCAGSCPSSRRSRSDQRRHVAGFAYVLGRVANADLDISQAEVALMEKTVMEIAGLPEAQAVLIVEISRNQAELYGGTEDFVVTREFAQHATEDQREKLLRCCFAIGAADNTITAAEVAELDEIGQELGFSDAQVRAIRNEFKEQLSAIQQMRRLPGVDVPPAQTS